MLRVTILEKGGGESQLAFNLDEISIGRIQGNDIVLPKGNISKRHACVMKQEGQYVLVDLQSTNGTYVNKQRVSAPWPVGEDDKVYVGDYVLSFVITEVSEEGLELEDLETGQYGPDEVAEVLSAFAAAERSTCANPDIPRPSDTGSARIDQAESCNPWGEAAATIDCTAVDSP